MSEAPPEGTASRILGVRGGGRGAGANSPARGALAAPPVPALFPPPQGPSPSPAPGPAPQAAQPTSFGSKVVLSPSFERFSSLSRAGPKGEVLLQSEFPEDLPNREGAGAGPTPLLLSDPPILTRFSVACPASRPCCFRCSRQRRQTWSEPLSSFFSFFFPPTPKIYFCSFGPYSPVSPPPSPSPSPLSAHLLVQLGRRGLGRACMSLAAAASLRPPSTLPTLRKRSRGARMLRRLKPTPSRYFSFPPPSFPRIIRMPPCLRSNHSLADSCGGAEGV